MKYLNSLMHVASNEKKDDEMKLPAWLIGRRFTRDHYKDKAAYEDMVLARSILLKDRPFWGILAIGLILVEDDQCVLPTMATDGHHIIYNPKFVRKLKKVELLFGIAHEILHCLYHHVGDSGRRGDRDAKLWNICGDYVINNELMKANVGERITTINILYDPQFDGWSTEKIYDFFMQNPDKIPSGGTFDLHIEVEVVPDDEWDDRKESESSGDGNGQVKVRMKQSDYDKMDKKWKENAVQAASAQKEHDERSGGAGSLPSFIQRMLEDLAKPKINWRHALQRYVRAILQRGYSYARPHKATFGSGMTIPGFRTRKNQLDCVVIIDTSGSVSREQLQVFLGELDGIMKSFGAYRIMAWCFEGGVVKESLTEMKKHGSTGSWDDIKKFLPKVKGGGGTDFMCNWDFMKEQRMKPRLAIMLTDGYPMGSWGDPMYCPTLFMMFGNSERVKPPFGIGIHYEDETKGR